MNMREEKLDDGLTLLPPVLSLGTKAALLFKSTIIRNGTEALIAMMWDKNSPDIQAVRNLLKHGVLIDGEDENGMTALSYAVLNEHQDIVSLLLARSAKIDIQNNRGETPLMLAARSGNGQIFKQLYSALPVKPDTKKFKLKEAVLYAAEGGHLGIVKQLKQIISLNECASSLESTPLTLAAKGGHGPLVTYLLEEKVTAGLEQEKPGQKTALVQAAENNHAEVVDLLMQYPNKDAEFQIKKIDLTLDLLKILKGLLYDDGEFGEKTLGRCFKALRASLPEDYKQPTLIKVNYIDTCVYVPELDGYSPIKSYEDAGKYYFYGLSANGQWELTKLPKEFDNRLPFFVPKSAFVSSTSYPDIYEYIKNKHSIDLSEKRKLTALFTAVETGCSKAVAMLLQKMGLKQEDIRTSKGETLMQLALKHKQGDVVELFLGLASSPGDTASDNQHVGIVSAGDIYQKSSAVCRPSAPPKKDVFDEKDDGVSPDFEAPLLYADDLPSAPPKKDVFDEKDDGAPSNFKNFGAPPSYEDALKQGLGEAGASVSPATPFWQSNPQEGMQPRQEIQPPQAARVERAASI